MTKTRRNYRDKSYNYGRRNQIGSGYVIIPKDSSRDRYIEHCYRTSTVFILTENNEYITNVKIDKASLREVDFPEIPEELGSLVLWANYEKHNFPIVFGVYGKGDDFSELSEEEFSFSKSFKKSKVQISGNAKERYILVNASSEEGSEIVIQCTDPNSKSKFKLIVKGDIDIESNKTIKLKTVDNLEILLGEKKLSLTKESLKYTDENDNTFTVDSEGVSFLCKSFKIGEEESLQFMVLGEALKAEIEKEKTALTDLMESISTAPITPGDGGATLKAAIITAINSIALKRGDYSKILSEISKTS